MTQVHQMQLDLDLGHLPDTQRYLGLLSEQCTPIQTFWGQVWGSGLVVVVVAHRILVTAQRPNSPFIFHLAQLD